MENIDISKESFEKLLSMILGYLPNIIKAILVLIIGLWIIRTIVKMLRKFFDRKDYDITLEKFILDLVNWGLKVVLIILIVTQLGVKSTSLVALLGAAGLAVGLALQGSLSNFAGGVLILLFKPFRVGDWISAQGADGSVRNISIFHTHLVTFGNQQVIIPNGKLSNDKITNYTVEGKRRDNLKIGISYNSDIKLAKNLLLELVNGQQNVIQDEGLQPVVVVDALGDSSVVLSLRYWALNEHFWDIHFYTLEESKKVLESNDISIPFPQRDLHIIDMPQKSGEEKS